MHTEVSKSECGCVQFSVKESNVRAIELSWTIFKFFDEPHLAIL